MGVPWPSVVRSQSTVGAGALPLAVSGDSEAVPVLCFGQHSRFHSQLHPEDSAHHCPGVR